MNIPQELKYSQEHEWVRLEDNSVAIIGITDHAQDQLGDIVYLELPAKGDQVEKDEPCGVLESTKAVSDIFAPISGKVLDVNATLVDEPNPINQDPFDDGWLLRITVDDMKDLEGLMSATEYEEFLRSEG